MIQLPYEKLVEKIVENGNISENEVAEKIRKKMDSLSGLISKEGAAHILANELGVKLSLPSKERILI